VLIAPLMGIDKKGGFQYIQEYTGFVSPGILAMFLLGFFWKQDHAAPRCSPPSAAWCSRSS
jgi:SSS family solute:Na+ symporter